MVTNYLKIATLFRRVEKRKQNELKCGDEKSEYS